MSHAQFLSVLIGALAGPCLAQQPAAPAPAKTQPVEAAPQPGVVQALQAEADLLKPLTSSKLAWEFLNATSQLIDPGTRTIVRNREKGLTLTVEQFEKLPEAERAGFIKQERLPRFYYYTGYGTPLMYVRALDLLAQTEDDRWAPDELPKKQIIDFGCGTIGHMRLLASLGADVTGIDVEPLFDALYSKPGDQGEIAGKEGKKGHVRLLTGQWPAQDAIVNKVKERQGEGYDLFISKNTLKRGYIHPAREADPSRLVHLGVTDDVFVKAVYDLLKPGGVFMIYNISPGQAPADKPYIPHADGECPFPRDLLEKAGFEVVKFDENDQETILKYWKVLGYDNAQPEEIMKQDLFAWWTLCRKPSKRSDAGKGEIRITRNYAAEYNAEVAKTPEEQRAWLIYRQSYMKLIPASEELTDAGWPFGPDHELWPKAVQHLDENREALRLIREAVKRPRMGMPMADQTDPEIEEFLAKRNGETFEPVAPSPNPMLFNIMLPQLGHLRHCARMLLMDSRRAYLDADAPRFVDNCRTLAAVGRHATDPPALIGSLVCIAIHSLLNSVVMEQLVARPDLLDDDQMRSVAHVLAGIDDLPVLLDGLDADRTTFIDFLQRTYTDDGKGDGVMTDEGWAQLQRITSDLMKPVEAPDFIKASVADRAEMLAEYDKLHAELRALIERPRWEWDRSPEIDWDERYPTLATKAKFALVGIVLPATGKAGLAVNQVTQQRDAALVAIALERFKRRNNAYPESLAALIPDFLPAVPPDRFDGKPLKYRLADGKPLVYSVGADRDDDQGRYPEGKRMAANLWRSPAELAAAKRGDPDAPRVPDADLVLYPEPAE